ncbi:MAG: hypothetical protein K2K74_14255 [Lachnospiraceae bacterium]|nr:hypothetical protein [Lachnospiraceae bacterium]
MNKPMTTEELFNEIHGILKENGKLPSILDYGLATRSPVPIKTYEFDLVNKLALGGSEGIYLDLWIEHYVNDEKERKRLGTFKTLYEDDEAMHAMAGLLADFIIEGRTYVNAHLDDFIWEGVDVHALDQNGKRYSWGYTCCDMEAALQKKDELLKKYLQVVVRDNATRKEEMFSQDG